MSPEARRRRRVRTPVLAVTALAWLAMLLAHPLGLGSGGGTTTEVHQHGVHEHLHVVPADAGGSAIVSPGSLGMWALMLLAMMTPLLIAPLRHVSARSLPRRRLRALVLLVLAAAVVWLAAAPLLLAAARLLELTAVPFVAGLVVVAVWQQAPVKQRCLNRHHAHPPLAAFGLRADRDVLRYGARHAFWCLGSCWALMVLPLLAGPGHLAAMAVASLWMWAELFDRPRVPAWDLRIPVRALRILRVPAPRAEAYSLRPA